MSWYEYQPFRWILENLSARQITNIIIAIVVISLLVGSYYVYLDFIQSVRNNPYFSRFLKNLGIFLILIIVVFLIFSFEFMYKIGLD